MRRTTDGGKDTDTPSNEDDAEDQRGCSHHQWSGKNEMNTCTARERNQTMHVEERDEKKDG